MLFAKFFLFPPNSMLFLSKEFELTLDVLAITEYFFTCVNQFWCICLRASMLRFIGVCLCKRKARKTTDRSW